MSSTTGPRELVSPVAPTKSVVARSTARETWRWLWSDTRFRLAPFALAVAI